jgi:hypothetical protein
MFLKHPSNLTKIDQKELNEEKKHQINPKSKRKNIEQEAK